MKLINIKEDFGEYDAGNAEKIKLFIDRIDLGVEQNIVLSFRHCITDYPATSLIVDRILFQLKKLPGKKSLIIQTELDDIPIIILNSLFHGSSELQLNDTTGLIVKDEIDKAISENLEASEIVIRIEKIDFHGKVIELYYEK